MYVVTYNLLVNVYIMYTLKNSSKYYNSIYLHIKKIFCVLLCTCCKHKLSDVYLMYTIKLYFLKLVCI